MAGQRQLQLSVILSAYDRMSRVVNDAVNKSSASLKRFSEANSKRAASFAAVGTGAATMAAASAAVMAGPLMAYAELEDASTRLRSAMMKDGGVMDANFERVNQLAVELGNKLPGTTADFQEMMLTLTRQGVASETILNGVGKSAAYLAVQLRLPYDEAGKMAAKLKEATGVADKDFMAFMDTIARTNQMGVDAGEMQYAFSRSAGALKSLNLQGLEASKSLSAMYAILIKAGVSGETAGTGMTAVFRGLYDADKMAKFNAEAAKLGLAFKFQDNKGNFLGIENMMAQFDKMKKLNTDQRMSLVNALTGGGADAGFVDILANKGVAGYNEMVKRMAEQATLQRKVDEQLKTLKATWEATTGTFQNTMAGFFATIAPDVQRLAAHLGKLAEKLGNFTKEHPRLARIIALTIVGFGAMMVAVSGVAFVFSGVAKVMSIYGTIAPIAMKAFAGLASVLGTVGKVLYIVARAVMFLGRAMFMAIAANPIVLAIAAIIAAIVALYVYWDEAVDYFRKSGPIMQAIMRTVASPFVLVTQIVRSVVKAIKGDWRGALQDMINVIREFTPFYYIEQAFDKIWPYMKGLYARMNAAGQKIVDMIIQGIKNKAHAAVDALKDMVASMRDYLPFSPAKKGAFKDLHRVKIVETIAQAVKPKPLVNAMRAVTVAGMVAATPTAGMARGAASAPSGGGSGGGSVVVNYNPTINIGGGSGQSEDFKRQLAAHKDEIARMVADVTSRKERRSFN